MSKEFISIVYFTKPMQILPISDKILDFINYLQNNFSISFDILNFTYRNNDNNKLAKKKSLKYNNTNVNKLIEVSESVGLSIVECFVSNNAKNVLEDSLLHFIICKGNVDGCIPGHVGLFLKPDIIANKTLNGFRELYFSITNQVLKMGASVEYGIVFAMESRKLPSMYILGIINPELSLAEKEEAFTWWRHKRNYSDNIWDIFWGNLWSKSHINMLSSAENQLYSIVGEENIAKINEDYIFINMPINIFEIQDKQDKHLEIQKTLRNLLQLNNLLMTREKYDEN